MSSAPPLAEAVLVVPLVVAGREDAARRELRDVAVVLAEQVLGGTLREVRRRSRRRDRDAEGRAASSRE